MTELEQELLSAFEALSDEFAKSQSASDQAIAALSKQVQDLTEQVNDLSSRLTSSTEALAERITRLKG